jgi:hypothetical protein
MLAVELVRYEMHVDYWSNGLLESKSSRHIRYIQDEKDDFKGANIKAPGAAS